jgi:hypothetical protein
MDSLLGTDLESSELALHALAAHVVRSGAPSSVAAATPFLVALLDRGERPAAPDLFLSMLARIAVGDPDAVACGSAPAQDGALELTEATPEEAEAEREARRRCEQAVTAGASVYVRWLRASSTAARSAAAHLLAFVARGDGTVDQALADRARDDAEQPAVRASALLALGLRGAARAEDLPPPRAQELGEATLLEAAAAFAALGSRDPALVKTAERNAVDVLSRGVALPPRANAHAWPWPRPERLLLAKLSLGKGRSARAQSALLRLLPLARDRARGERIATHLLVLAFGEPTAAAFSDWKPSLEVFPGASGWSAEQRTVLRAIASLDILWPPAAEMAPRVRHVDACAVQIALKRMLELAYYPSRQGLRAAIALVLNAGAGVARR